MSEKDKNYLNWDTPWGDEIKGFTPERPSSVMGVDEYGNLIHDPHSEHDEDGNPKRVFDEDGTESFIVCGISE